jgi:chaperonin cofactor prefoldin
MSHHELETLKAQVNDQERRIERLMRHAERMDAEIAKLRHKLLYDNDGRQS